MSLWVEARDLSIIWGDTPKYWKWTTLDDNSRSEVAELVDVCWLDIKGIIDIKKLLIKTNYVVFLVFKLKEDSYGLKKANSSVRFLNGKTEGESTVFIDKKKVPGERGRFPQPRTHGWMEIKLGEFFNNLGEDGDVEFRLFETENGAWMSGLIVKGIDVRPNY